MCLYTKFYLSTSLSLCLSLSPRSPSLAIYRPICRSFHRYIHPPIYRSIDLSVCRSIYLPTYLSNCFSLHIEGFGLGTLQCGRLKNSRRWFRAMGLEAPSHNSSSKGASLHEKHHTTSRSSQTKMPIAYNRKLLNQKATKAQ